MFGLRVEPQPKVDFFYDGAGPVAVRQLRRVGASHAGTLPRRRVPGDRARRRRRSGRSLSATRCSPAPSAATDLPGGDHQTLLRSIRDVLFTFPGRDRRVSRATASRRPSAARSARTRSCSDLDTDGLTRLRRCGCGTTRDDSAALIPASSARRATTNSTRPTPSRSPSFSARPRDPLPLTNVPFVLSRSSTSSSVAPAVSRQCSRDTIAASTMNSAPAERPMVLMLPGRMRKVNGSFRLRLRFCSSHMRGYRLPRTRGVDDFAAAREQRLARDLVVGVDRQRRLRRAVLAEQVREEGRDVLRVHLARVVRHERRRV